MQLGFDVQDSHVGDVRYDDDFTLDAGDRSLLTLPIAFEWAGVGTALQAALKSGEIPYRMKGQLGLQTPWGEQSVPFTKEGRVPLTRMSGVAIPTGR